MSKKQGLSGEDRELWEHVKKSAKALKNRRAAGIEEFKDFIPPEKPARQAKPAKPPESAPKPSAKSPPALANLDRRTKSRVARGHIEIGARIDLHGMTLERAHRRLETFLFDAQDDGIGLVLVITGKGRSKSSDGFSESGALKREVPLWLSEPRLRAVVIGFEEAAISHGGSGALYVRVRRAR